MALRSNRLRRIPNPIPPDWIRHDGTGCPLPFDTPVKVQLRRGTRTQGNETAGFYERFYQSPWRWTDEGRGCGDIIAYFPLVAEPH